jgi:hypothetical protein
MAMAGRLPLGCLRQDTLTAMVKCGEVQHGVVLRLCDRLQLADVWGRQQETRSDANHKTTHVALCFTKLSPVVWEVLRVQTPLPKLQSFDKAEPNYQFRGIYIHNNVIRIRVSFIYKSSETLD